MKWLYRAPQTFWIRVTPTRRNRVHHSANHRRCRERTVWHCPGRLIQVVSFLHLHQAERGSHVSKSRHCRPERRRKTRLRHQATQSKHRPVRELLEAESGYLQTGSLPARWHVPLAARPGLVHRMWYLVFTVRGLRLGW